MKAPVALIAEDEPLLAAHLQKELTLAWPELVIGATVADGASAAAQALALRPDVCFLDIRMPGSTGLEAAQVMAEDWPDAAPFPLLVFVTAYDQYALEAFDVHAVDYLLKPFDETRFAKALARARSAVQAQRSGEVSDRLLALLRGLRAAPAGRTERLVVKSAGRLFFLRTEEIDWIESSGNYVCLHVGTETHLLRETMSSLEARLDPASFIRIHRTAIVNVDRIKELQPLFHGEYEVVLRGGARLTLSRSYRDRLQCLLGKDL